jgi:hypothetical protein
MSCDAQSFYSLKYNLCSTHYRQFLDHRREVAGWQDRIQAIRARMESRLRRQTVVPPVAPDPFSAPDAYFYNRGLLGPDVDTVRVDESAACTGCILHGVHPARGASCTGYTLY